MIANLISPPPSRRSLAWHPFLLSRDETGDLVDYRHLQIGIDRQAENLLRCDRCHREVLSMGGRQTAIHGEVRYQGVKIAARMDAVIFELPVKVVPADRVAGFDQDRKIRIVGDLLTRVVQATDTFHFLKSFTIKGIDFFASFHSLIYVLQLQQPQCCVEFTHFAVDAGSHHGDFAHMTEVLQLVDAYFGLRIGTHDGAAFKGGEHFGGMKAQHRQVTMPEYAALRHLALQKLPRRRR